MSILFLRNNVIWVLILFPILFCSCIISSLKFDSCEFMFLLSLLWNGGWFTSVSWVMFLSLWTPCSHRSAFPLCWHCFHTLALPGTTLSRHPVCLHLYTWGFRVFPLSYSWRLYSLFCSVPVRLKEPWAPIGCMLGQILWVLQPPRRFYLMSRGFLHLQRSVCHLHGDTCSGSGPVAITAIWELLSACLVPCLETQCPVSPDKCLSLWNEKIR